MIQLTSILGCLNDRVIQLRQVFRNAQFIKEAQHILASPHFSTVSATSPPQEQQSGPGTKQKKDTRFRVPVELSGTRSSKKTKQNDPYKGIH